jgi:hypothetical protein
MAASNQIFLVVDAGTPVAAFTARQELKAHLRRRLDTFINPLVCTFWGSQGPSIMTMSARNDRAVTRLPEPPQTTADEIGHEDDTDHNDCDGARGVDINRANVDV